MRKLPATSEGGLRKGMWFVFHDGENTIRAWGSSFSGLERVYVGDEVVSEQRNLKSSSGHAFTIDSDRYVVRFIAVSILKGQLNCRLLKNGVLLKSYVSGYAGTIFSFSGLLLSVVAAGLVAGSAALLQLPPWLAIPCVFVVAFGVAFVFRPKYRIVFAEEVQPTTDEPPMPSSQSVALHPHTRQ